MNKKFLNADAMTVEDNTVSSNVTKINSNLNINDYTSTTISSQLSGIDSWEPYIGTCPHCGSSNIEANYGLVLTSIPPRYNCRCKDCKGTFFSGHTVTPNIIPGLPVYPNEPQKPQYDWGNARQGWICPRCGKVNSPDRQFCDCSNSGWGSPIVWCNSGSGTNPNPAPTQTIATTPNPNTEANPSTYTSEVNSIGTSGESKYQLFGSVEQEAMKKKFMDESESIFEAVSKYQEWQNSKIS